MFALPGMFCFFAVVIIPFVYGIYLTLTDWNGVAEIKNFVGFKNFQGVVKDEQFWTSLLLTFKYVILVVVLVNVLLCLADGLYRLVLRSRPVHVKIAAKLGLKQVLKLCDGITVLTAAAKPFSQLARLFLVEIHVTEEKVDQFLRSGIASGEVNVIAQHETAEYLVETLLHILS